MYAWHTLQTKLTPLPSGLPRERIRAMGDRKSDRVPCRKGGVDLPHRNGRTPTPCLLGKRLGEYTHQRAFHGFDVEAAMLCVGASQ